MKDTVYPGTSKESSSMFVAYYPLALIVIGTPLNLLTFIVLSRSLFRDTKRFPALHYVRVIAIFDILMLYGWNLNHYSSGAYGFSLLYYSIATCKIISFLSFVVAQSSAWFRVFLCLDRYLLLSRLHRTWFSQSKSILIVIICIIIIFAIFNVHILIFTFFYDETGNINTNAPKYIVYPMWDYVHLGVYDVVPFFLMLSFNSAVIYHLIRYRRTSVTQATGIHHRSISITLASTTTLFLIMTVPSSVVFAGFFSVVSDTVLRLMDSIYFTYHILSFPLYFISYNEFRREMHGYVHV